MSGLTGIVGLDGDGFAWHVGPNRDCRVWLHMSM